MADLISLSLLKGVLEIPTVTDHDVFLRLLISGCTPMIENFLNRKFLKEERTVLFNGGRTKYYIDAPPIDSEADLVVTVDDDEQVKGDDFVVDYQAGMIRFLSTTDCDPLGVSITYTGGYDLIDDSDADDFGTLAVPYDIKLGVALQCSYIFRRRETLGLSFISLPNGQMAPNVELDLLPIVKKRLAHYWLPAGEK